MARRKNPESEAPVEPEMPVTDAVGAPEPVDEAPEPFVEVVDGPSDRDPLPPPPPDLPPAPMTRQRSGIIGPLLGGALAAVGGFGLSHFNVLGLAGPDSSAQVAALSSRLGALEGASATEPAGLSGVQTDISNLQGRITALEESPTPPLPDLSALDRLDQRLAAIEAMPAGGDASTAALAAKLAELERRLAALPQATLDTSEMDAALARLEAAEAEANARATAATEAAAAAERAVALDRLRAAAATGAAFDAELAALNYTELTATLSPHAAGVATVAEVQGEFPELARQALEVARTAAGDQGWGARFLNFLSSQTGARPLTPQEGTTPEAILSRADFAVNEGRLADALAEIATLPPDVQAVFTDWTARANARLAVDTALEAQ